MAMQTLNTGLSGSALVVGYLRGNLLKQGIKDLDAIADEVQRARAAQSARNLYSADHFSERGVDSRTRIVSGESQTAKDCILWSVNLYLGLNRHPRVIAKTMAAVEAFGTGSGSSAPSGGMCSLHREIERRFAEMTGKERAILFPTGFAANMGAMASLPGPDDLVILDRESHASIIDGCRLSGRRYITFEHNDVQDLARKLEMSRGRHPNVFVVVESAYSMSGDLCPLKEIVALKDQHRFYLYVDEAHSFGFYGPEGRGYCVEQGVMDQVDFFMTTLSKATAATGGVIATRHKFCTLLQSSARAYIFQATMTPASAATVLASLDELTTDPTLAMRLHDNAAYMRNRLRENGFDLGTSKSPIIPIYVPEVATLNELNARLHQDGIYTVVVVYPAVEQGRGRLRFIVTASHTREQIDRTVECLSGHARDLGILADAA